jgi:porphobilinogen synthase
MLHHGAQARSFELKPTVLEVLTSMRRAGADVIISYFTPTVLEWMREKN